MREQYLARAVEAGALDDDKYITPKKKAGSPVYVETRRVWHDRLVPWQGQLARCRRRKWVG
jgi:hypothetical protein